MPGTVSTTLHLSGCTVNLLSGRVQREGDALTLSARELACLSYLAKHPGQAVSREELLEKVWHYDAQVISRTVDATVRRLRKKIESKPSDPVHLLTVHGAGYRLEGAKQNPVRPHARPAPELIGRSELLAALHANKAKLLTLTGPPGIGKSQLAAALAHKHPGTVLWADLSQAGPDLQVFLPTALDLRAPLAEALSVVPDPLVVLDNAQAHARALAEHLMAWAEHDVRVICTSRVPLDLPHEYSVSIPGLSSPTACTLLGGSSEIYADLAHALDHNPLALTLAREPCQLLGPEAVLERVRTQGDAFGSGQQSLDQAVQASWKLLSKEEQELLSLASFAPGGLPLEVLERWAGPGTLSAVQGLLRHALIRTHETVAGPRLEVPFPVAPFAREMQNQHGSLAFAEHMAFWARVHLDGFYGPQGEQARASLLAEAPNLLHAARTPGPHQQLCLAYWGAAVQSTLAPAILLQALQQGIHDTELQRAELAVEIARVQHTMGQFAASQATAELGLSLTPNAVSRLSLLDSLAYALSDADHPEEAQAVDTEAESIQVDPGLKLSWRINRANRLRRIAAPRAIADLETAWAEAKGLGSLRLAALAASHLATMYSWTGEFDEADALLTLAVQVSAPAGEWEGRGLLLQQAAALALGMGRLDQADAILKEAETTWRSLGRPNKLNILHLSRARLSFLGGDAKTALATLSTSIITAKSLARPERGRTARIYRGMIKSHIGDFHGALRDLSEEGISGSPVLPSLQHATRLLTLMRMGQVQAAKEQRARAPEPKMASLAQYCALAHSGMDLLLGEQSAREGIVKLQGTHPPSMEFKVLWGHLDWVLSQV